MISAIVAVDNNWGIGFNGDLLEHIPADLKHFKELTTGHIIVMGSKTWDSLPNKPLKDRLNLVISRQPRKVLGDMSIRIDMDEIDSRIIHNEWLEENGLESDDYFIIGGGQIYKELLPLCDRVYVTKIYKDHENVDTYFPNLDESDEWEAFCNGGPLAYKDFSYQFWIYDRIN